MPISLVFDLGESSVDVALTWKPRSKVIQLQESYTRNEATVGDDFFFPNCSFGSYDISNY